MNIQRCFLFLALSLLSACLTEPSPCARRREGCIDSGLNAAGRSGDAGKPETLRDASVGDVPRQTGDSVSDGGGPNTAVHDDGGAVVDDGGAKKCLHDRECKDAGDGDICDRVTGQCVECTSQNDEACSAVGEVCKSSTNVCVQCNVNDDCTDGAPRCDGDNRCAACEVDSQCARFGKVCGEAGRCVECTESKTQRCADGDVCNSLNNKCAVGVREASTYPCMPCVSDAQCGLGRPALCLPSAFRGESLGYFCLPTRQGRSCIEDNRPFAQAAFGVSISGRSEPACQLQFTTCNALADFHTTPCLGPEDDAACGVAELDDGICAPVQGVHRCTVPCGSDVDCNVGSVCTGANYCSL